MKSDFLRIGSGALLAIAPVLAVRGEKPAAPALQHPATRPNVVIILADDVAWGDIGSNGAIKTYTPHIDA